MDLSIETLFADDLELPHDTRQDQDIEAVLLLGTAGADAPHAEDAFLAKFARWLATRGAGADERRAGIELAREALDFIGDPDGTWQGLPVERWLPAAAIGPGTPSARRIELARELLSFVVECGRLSLHGQRQLTRRIARVRARARLVERRVEGADPRIAA
jgi:hypothetical protein